MQIATWNVNSLRVRLPQVIGWLSQSPVDVLAMQETKLVDDDFPRQELESAGYQVLFSGQ
jgi:exodeoxyribonuclease III